MGNNDGQDKDLNPGPLNLRPGALPIEKSGNGIQTSRSDHHTCIIILQVLSGQHQRH